MRLCVLGNSHVASLKLGLEKFPAGQRKVEMVFFASRGVALGALRLEGNRLVPSNENLARAIAHTSGGKSEVVLDEYDAFLVYGLGFRLPRVGRQLSSAVRAHVCHDAATQSLNHRICMLLRSGTDKSIHVGHDPQEAAVERNSQPSENLSYQAVFEQTKGLLLRDRLNLVAQPQATFADGWCTLPKFSAGSTRLDIGDEKSNEVHKDEDNKHMNGEYGRIWLDSFLSGPVVGTAS